MFVRYVAALSVAGVIGATGCASHRVLPELPEPQLGKDIPTFQAPDDPGAQDSTKALVKEPAGVLSLQDVLAVTLMKSPELAAFSWEVRAREAEILQADVWPNPSAAFDVENFAGSGEFDGFGSSEITFGLSQSFELGGKRGSRRTAAEHTRAIAAWDYETKRVDVFTKVVTRFVALLVAQEQAALAHELVIVAEQMLTSVTRRVEAGGISPVEEGRARVELQTLRIDLERAQRRVVIARHDLSATWGQSEPSFTEVEGSLEEVNTPPPLADVLVRANTNPDFARWTTELARREAVVAMERSRRVPDLEIGAGIRHFSALDDNAFVAALTIPLPTFNRNAGATQAAERRVAVGREEQRAASVAIQTRLATVYQQLSMNANEADQLRDDVIPEATVTFGAAQAAYAQGRMRLSDVLDTQRTLFALRLRYFDALGAYHQLWAEMERLIGAPLLDGEEG